MAGPQTQLPLSTVALDTSVWISRLLPQDINHAAARAWINNYLLQGGQLVAPVLLATEVAAAISRRTRNPARAHQAVTQLYNLPEMRLVPLTQGLVDEATDLSADLGLRGADAFFVAIARQLAIPLVTFDVEQLQKPSRIISTIRP